MRARIEALEQRLKETKREASDERARLEAELAEARSADPRDSPSAESPSRPKAGSSRARVAWLFGGMVALAIGWFVLVSLAFPSERIAGLRAVRGADGTHSLFVSEVVSHATEDSSIDTSRLAVYDLATGERRSRRVLQWTRGGGVTVLGPTPEGVWAHEHGGGVVVLDARDGSVLRPTEELLGPREREALLRSGELDERIGYLAAEQAVVVTLRDGTRLALDGEGTRPFAGELPAVPSPPHPSAATVRMLANGDVLRLVATEGDERHARRLQPSGARLLHGTFVVDSAGEPIVLADPASVLVQHTATLEEGADSLLSRVALETGESLWTTDLETAVRVRIAHPMDDAVALVTVDGELMAFDLEDGEERYRVSL